MSALVDSPRLLLVVAAFVLYFFHAGLDQEALEQSERHAKQLQEKLWAETMQVTQSDRTVIALIADIDSPRTGFIRIDRRPMQRLKSDFTSDGNRNDLLVVLRNSEKGADEAAPQRLQPARAARSSRYRQWTWVWSVQYLGALTVLLKT